jgi:aspartyl/asparaginyl-tRNA synthetase
VFVVQGELVGGSEREHRLPLLVSAMRARGLYSDTEDKGLDWYVDLRRYGGVPLAGWGMGFERLVQYVTGILTVVCDCVSVFCVVNVVVVLCVCVCVCCSFAGIENIRDAIPIPRMPGSCKL